MEFANNCSNCKFYSFCIIEKNSRNNGEGYTNENWCFNHSYFRSGYPEFIDETKFIEYQEGG